MEDQKILEANSNGGSDTNSNASTSTKSSTVITTEDVPGGKCQCLMEDGSVQDASACKAILIEKRRYKCTVDA